MRRFFCALEWPDLFTDQGQAMLTPQTPKSKSTPQHRRGDTLRIPCMALDAAGQPCNLNVRDLVVQLRDVTTDELIDVCRIVKGQTAGLFFIEAHYRDTEHWPLTTAVFDVQETLNDVRTSSDAQPLTITKDVTHAPYQ